MMMPFLNIMTQEPKKKRVWRTIKIPDGLITEIEKYLQTKDAEKRGFTSISGFVEHAVRKELGLS